jgi:hypothetical protein
MSPLLVPPLCFAAPMVIGYLVWWELVTKWQAQL